jgi:putative cardiolipin synthase
VEEGAKRGGLMIQPSIRSRHVVGMILFLVGLQSLARGQVPASQELRAAFQGINVGGADISTRVRLLHLNDEAWYARWKMLEQARQTIDCTYFIISKDVFGQAFLGHLAEKARQGVRVRLMIDWRISHSSYMSGMYDKLQELAGMPNVQVRLYNSAIKNLVNLFSDVRSIVAANHDKILIVDGQTAITGGRNIGADYFAAKGEFEIVYRDTDVILQGAYVASALKKAFDDEWVWSKNTIVKPDLINLVNQTANLRAAYLVMQRYLSGQGFYDPRTSPRDVQKILQALNQEIARYQHLTRYGAFSLFGGEPLRPVKILDKHARVNPMDEIGPRLIRFIDASKSEILIQNPYVVLTEAAEEALTRASRRGVRIIFHSNSGGSTDNLFPQAFLMTDLVRIFRKMPTVRFLAAPDANARLHSKVFVFDSQLAVVGSFNMDPLSAEINSEIVAAIDDPQFATYLRGILGNDMKGTVEYKVTFDANGKVKTYYGPESHLPQKIIDKMNRVRALRLLRPLI